MKQFIAFIILATSPFTTFACSCHIGSVEKKFENHVSIFQGTVEEIIYYNSQDQFGDQHIQVTFNIEKQWKGTPQQNKLFTVHNGASCYGYWFQKNDRYIVYAFEDGETLNTWWCGGVISQSEDEKGFENEADKLNLISK